MSLGTDYGRPIKLFFIEIQNFWAWADKFWGIWGIFVTVSPLSMFFIFQPLFLHIPNIYLGLGYEFGPQRVRDLPFVCP